MQAPVLGIGTVQLGMPYGVSNEVGQPDPASAREVVRRASELGVGVLDTASAYGSSEDVIGSSGVAASFRIITKTPAVPTGMARDEAYGLVRATAIRSIERLGLSRLDGLLVHEIDDLDRDDGAVRQALDDLRAEGLVDRVGVSVYDAAAIEVARSRLDLDIVQVPTSILDQRLLRSGHLARMHDAGIEVHVRSVLVQGLLALDPERLPPSLSAAVDPLRRLRTRAAAARLSPVEAALGFAANLACVDVVLVGVTSVAELEASAAAFAAARSVDAADLGIDDASIVDPRGWTS